ncbi:hypothetical protein [Streptomyces alfalfae]
MAAVIFEEPDETQRTFVLPPDHRQMPADQIGKPVGLLTTDGSEGAVSIPKTS